MNEDQEIKRVLQALEDHKIKPEDLVPIALMVDNPQDRAQMIDFLNENPQAGEQEIVSLARNLLHARLKQQEAQNN